MPDDRGQLENVHKLPRGLLSKREVVHVDIVNDEVDAKVRKRPVGQS